MSTSALNRRILALKKIQLDIINLEAQFYADVHKLECKCNTSFQELYSKREKFITGTIEPTDEDCYLQKSVEDQEENLIKALQEKLTFDENAKGIPEFWLTIFRNVEILNDMIQPHDLPILKHLYDLKVIYVEEPMSFILEFYFSTNKYFSNKVLTKEYIMKCSPDENDPWSFEGPEIYKCKGCTIDWYKGMNITVKTLKKRQRHKSRGAVRTVLRIVQNDSFFNFFNPPVVPDDQEGEVDDVTQTLLTSDFEIGHYIRERIIPHAVLYYTGEALDDEEMDDDSTESTEESYEECNDDDDDDEEDAEEEEELTTDDSEEPGKITKKTHKSKSNKKKENSNQNPECSQQ